MKEPPVIITITDEKSLLKALTTVLELMEHAYSRAYDGTRVRKIEED